MDFITTGVLTGLSESESELESESDSEGSDLEVLDSEEPDSDSSDNGEAFFWVPLAFTFFVWQWDDELELVDAVE